MRRFIAYIMMALTILLAVGVSATPIFSRMNAGREFTNSYEIVYTVESSEDKNADETIDISNKSTGGNANYNLKYYSDDDFDYFIDLFNQVYNQKV